MSSVQWGGWAGGGMASADSSTAGRLARMGMPLITPSQGLAALAGILSSQSLPPTLSAVPFVWSSFLQHSHNSTAPTFAEFATHLPVKQSPTTQLLSYPAAQNTPPSSSVTVTATQQAEGIAAAVHSSISSVLGSSVSSTAPLMAAGLDSLSMVELRNALQTKLGLQLPATLLFDYPTADDVTGYITAQLPALDSVLDSPAQDRGVTPLPGGPQGSSMAQASVPVRDLTPVVQEVVGGVLGVTPAGDAPLMAAGLDSLGMVEVRNALQTRLGLHLPSTLLFDHPTVDAISAFVSQQLAAEVPATQDSTQAVLSHPQSMLSVPQQQSARSQTMVVTALVVAAPQNTFQSTAAVDSITQVPLSRWDVDAVPEGLFTGPAVRFGSYLSSPAAFDAAAFNTSAAEAVFMDPQQRLLLQTAAEALTCAQLLGGNIAPNGAKQAKRNVGIFVGVSSSDYEKLVMRHTQGVTAYTATGRAASVTSGRLSYTFGLKGPSVTVDTACSSSLVSLHMAYNSLMLGQCSAACNSGVNVMISPETPAAFQKAGMLSADGRCKTLDSHADGYVRAEACGSMVVQVAGEARPSAVVAVFRGSAVNQDGRSSSLTAPNGPSQQGVIRQALQASALEPSDVQALQLHGTGMSNTLLMQHACSVSPTFMSCKNNFPSFFCALVHAVKAFSLDTSVCPTYVAQAMRASCRQIKSQACHQKCVYNSRVLP